MREHPAEQILVPEAVGPALPLPEVVGAIALGSIALLVTGLMPLLLGALVAEHRLSAAGIGQTAMLELLSMGLTTALAGLWLKPERLKLIGAVATLALVAADLATMQASGSGIFAARFAAGLGEGILLWITIAMIARTQTPERWSAIFVTATTVVQMLLAPLLTSIVLPRFGAGGGYAVLAAVSLPGFVFAVLVSPRYAPLVKPEGEGGTPPPRGWMALFATFVFVACFGAVGVYTVPIVQQIGLTAQVAGAGISASLLGQVLGGSSAALLAGRVRYLPVFAAGTLCFLGIWTLWALPISGWVFVVSDGFAGFLYMLMLPFLVPMAIEADPSRRAAVLSGAAQVLAGAMGPLASSFAVGKGDMHGALYLGAGLIVSGTAMMAGMHAIAQRERARRQLAVAEPAGQAAPAFSSDAGA